MPSLPPSSSTHSSDPAPVRRAPSRRVSDLVARFEATSSTLPSPQPPSSSSFSSTFTRLSSTSRLSQNVDVRSSSFRRVQNNVRPLSAGPSSPPTVQPSSPAAASLAAHLVAVAPPSSPSVTSGSVGAMDWTPRTPTSPFPAPTSPCTTSEPSSFASTPSLPPSKVSHPRTMTAKATAAAVVTVPAVVSSSGGVGRTKVEVVRAEKSKQQKSRGEEEIESLALSKRRPAVDGKVRPITNSSEEKVVSTPTRAPTPPLPTPPPPFTVVETRRPSIAFIEATPPRPSSRSTSAPSSSTHNLKPPRLSLPIRTNTSPSTLSPSSSAPPRRPALTRASTTNRSSAFTTSNFSVPPTPSSACDSSATRSLPAYLLFARNADPLILPDLDRVLEELGGPAEFSPMPAVADEGDEMEKERLKDEEWELGSMSKGREGEEEERVENAGGGFGSEVEREAWEKWVRGSPPSRWRRLRAVLGRRDLEAEEREERRRRTLVFPPFHLLPARLTVTDLKVNRQKPPPLLSFQSLVLKAANGLVTGATSTYGLSLTTIEGLRDLMQMVTLLVTAASPTLSSLTAGSTSTRAAHNVTAFRTLLVTVPSFLSLDFVSAFGQALIFLLVLTVVTLAALYELYRFTGGWTGPNGSFGRGKLDLGEGYDREDLQERRRSWRDSYSWKVAVTFWLSSIYLPLSKLAIGALAFTDDYWPVPNPYKLYDTDNPSPPSLGPSSEFYSSLDFCWKTTMRRRDGLEHINWVFVIVPIAIVVVLLLSFWLPWRLMQVVKREAPQVDKFTELGENRRDKNGEYERLLDADPSPFNFLYREYRRPWAAYRSIYLVVKLVNVLLVVLISKDNCAFRSFSTTYLSVVRQGCLLAFMGLWFGLSAWSSPFLNTPSNSSDVASRVGYTILAMLGLLAALSMPGTDGAVIATNVVLYSLNVYFALIGIGYSQSLVKKLQRRLDFSVDIFSPRIDLAKHLSRRVWQESWAALILCAPDLAMPAKEKLNFSREPGFPPYQLAFKGTVGERFVENIKILRECGLDAYHDAISYRDLPSDSRIMQLRRLIQQRFAGPDAFYHPPNLTLPVTSFFGRVDIVPFPFVVVFRYDQQPTVPLFLVDIDDLDRLVSQNSSAVVSANRKVRLALRALEGQPVHAPHVEVRKLGTTGQAEIERHLHFTTGTLRIERNSTFLWQGYNHSSGFSVKVEYVDGAGVDRDGRPQKNLHLTLPGAEFGVLDDFTLTQPLAALFRRNRSLIEQRLPLVEKQLQRHRDFFLREAEKKHQTLSHSFLLTVFAEDSLALDELDYLLRSTEKNEKVRNLARTYRALFTRLEERMDAVKADGVRGWWALFWDDLWRRNSDVLGGKAVDFSPFYRTSICYNPMTRSQLEAFLHSRGLSTTGKDYFHAGFLNRLYFCLDERIFDPSSSAIPIHLGNSSARVPFADLSHALSHQHPLPSPPPLLFTAPAVAYDSKPRAVSNGTLLSRFTADTGGGTQEDERSIRQRPAFLFEEAYERPRPPFKAGHRKAWLKFMVEERFVEKSKEWLGLTPVLSDWRPSEEEGVMLDLRRGRVGWELPRQRKGRKGDEEDV